MSVVACPFCGAKDVHESPPYMSGMRQPNGYYRCRACGIEFVVQERALDGAWVRLPR